MFDINDRVVAKHEIIDGDGFLCAKPGDIGVVIEVIDDEPGNDAYDVEWPGASSVTGGHEMELWVLRLVA